MKNKLALCAIFLIIFLPSVHSNEIKKTSKENRATDKDIIVVQCFPLPDCVKQMEIKKKQKKTLYIRKFNELIKLLF